MTNRMGAKDTIQYVDTCHKIGLQINIISSLPAFFISLSFCPAWQALSSA